MAGRGGDSMAFLNRQVAGWCWMHDTSAEMHTSTRPWPQHARRVQWGLTEDDVSFHPYWKQTLVESGDAKILISVWTRPGWAFVQVYNKAREKRTAELALGGEALGLEGEPVVRDLESGPQLAAVLETLAARDAGESVKDERLQDRLISVAKKDYAFDELERVGGAEASIEVDARDLRLLVVRPKE